MSIRVLLYAANPSGEDRPAAPPTTYAKSPKMAAAMKWTRMLFNLIPLVHSNLQSRRTRPRTFGLVRPQWPWQSCRQTIFRRADLWGQTETASNPPGTLRV